MSIDDVRDWARGVLRDIEYLGDLDDLDDDELSNEVDAIRETAELIVDMCEEREPAELDFG